MKVHRNVSVVELEDPPLLTELLAATALGEAELRRLSDRVVVVDADRLDLLLEELLSRGYPHRVVEP